MLLNDNTIKNFDFINEKYRILRNNIMHLEGMDKVKIISIADVDGKIEKEKIISNLGSVYSKLQKKRILVIDADFKKKKLHETFGLNNKSGLYNAVLNPGMLIKSFQAITENTFYFLGTGPSPEKVYEFLCTDEMNRILEFIRKNFDLTIINSPSICGNSDAQIISSFSDGTIMLVKVGVTKVKMIKEAKTMLEKVNANLLGAIAVN